MPLSVTKAILIPSWIRSALAFAASASVPRKRTRSASRTVPFGPHAFTRRSYASYSSCASFTPSAPFSARSHSRQAMISSSHLRISSLGSLTSAGSSGTMTLISKRSEACSSRSFLRFHRASFSRTSSIALSIFVSFCSTASFLFIPSFTFS